MNFINPKDLGIDPTKIEAIQDNVVAGTASARVILANLESVSATLKAMADQLGAKFQLPPKP